MSDDDDFDVELAIPVPRKATREKKKFEPGTVTGWNGKPVDENTTHRICYPPEQDGRKREYGKEHGFCNNPPGTPWMECLLCRNIELDAVRKHIRTLISLSAQGTSAVAFVEFLLGDFNTLEHRKNG